MIKERFYHERNRLYKKLPWKNPILNLGCGSGSFCKNYPYESIIVNIDIGEDIRTGWPAYGVENKGWGGFKEITCNIPRFINMDMDILSLYKFPSNSFEMIIAGQVIEHFSLEDAHVICEEISRILSNTGVFQLDTPNVEYTGIKGYEKDIHKHEYTLAGLYSLLEDHGLRITAENRLANDYGFFIICQKQLGVI